MDKKKFNDGLLEFLQCSPTPFHAAESLSLILGKGGFKQLLERDSWTLDLGGKYFVQRNDSSIIAFIYGQNAPEETGVRMVGAHTDSPCLMVKPKPEKRGKGYFQVGVEVYGGALLNPWFDRDLSLAGRVIYRHQGTGKLEKVLIDFKRPVAVIPSLAIHLDREANKNRSINPQTDIPPILFQEANNTNSDFREILSKHLLDEKIINGQVEVLDYELCCYDTQPPAIVGLHEEFISSARLDNLLSCYTGSQALLCQQDMAASTAVSARIPTCLLVCNDHEEVGSTSACGAQGPFLQSVLERLVPDAEQRTKTIERSLMVSADNAHGIHPNYSAKHDENHGPILNAGPVVKVNVNQRYATNSVTSSLFTQWAESAGVDLQYFVTRSDMGCGSTIGPITASGIGVPTLDVGVPTFAMHSVRELAGVDDAYGLHRILDKFFRSETVDI